VFTVGHSVHANAALQALLARHGVAAVADVRRWPRSRRVPDADGRMLGPALAAEGRRYVHLPGLGGFRAPRPDSPNGGWRNASFRGYADHMATPEFQDALAELEALAGEVPTAVMCAEALPWRCHRRLVADALIARGWEVLHIGSDGRAEPHRLTPFARVEGATVTYPA
jgi:uncharacterized protein (DUF488 family)